MGAADSEDALGAGALDAERVYGELHRLAVAQFRRQPAGHTLQPTALVHEAFLRLAGVSPDADRAHFLALAARVMRQVLVDHAREKATAKRGGSWERVTLSSAVLDEPAVADVDLLDLEAALEGLAALQPAYVRLVELRFFGGLSVEQAATVLGISRSEAQRRWRLARAWLARELRRGTAP